MIHWPPRWLIRRRHRKFQAWLDTRPHLKAKLEQASADLARTNRGALTIEQATENLRRALSTPSDRTG